MKFDTQLPASGTLHLQQCEDCGYVNYPPRELCGACLSDQLRWQAVADGGTVLSQSDLHYSLEPAYAERIPLTITSVQLDAGPVALTHAAPGCEAGERVTVHIMRDADNNRLLVATPQSPKANKPIEPWLQTMGFQEITS